MSSVEQKIREVLDELQAQVVEGYAGPVNGWTTLKGEAAQAILQIIESDVIGEDSGHTPDAEAHFDSPSYKYACCERTQANNRLRAEQREALKRKDSDE